MPQLSMGGLALPTTAGEHVAWAGSGPHPLFPALGWVYGGLHSSDGIKDSLRGWDDFP